MLMVAEAANGRDAIQRFREHVPDVTLMDLRLPDMSGIEAMIGIRSEFPDARIIILTTFAGESEIRRALDAGARAYLLKTMPPRELVEAIRQVHAGKTRIPPEVAAHLPAHGNGEPLAEREVEKSFLPLAGAKLSEDRRSESQGTVQRWVSRLFGRD
jgi:DNA-binding NarL/FixJ family response regulator